MHRFWRGLALGAAVGVTVGTLAGDAAPAIATGTACALGVWFQAWDLIVRRSS